MSYKSNLIYYYDGTYDGLMCCVFESFEKKEVPIAIELYDEDQSTLFSVKEIITDPVKAERVKKSIPARISLEAKELIEGAYLTCQKEKELHILYFMRLGYKLGGKVCEMIANEDVAVLKKAVLHLAREAHLLLGFVRFSEYDGVLLSVITPKNNVLPMIAEHFCSRFSGENFMIFDKTHKMALVHRDGRRAFVYAENIEEPEAGPEEELCRAHWKTFYNTIAIEGRLNPRCCQNHMPKRYRPNLTEFSA